MTRSHRARRPSVIVVVGGALVLSLFGGLPAQASQPPDPVPSPRPDRPAWDRPSADDPDQLIVTFRPGTTAAAGRSAIAHAGGAKIADVKGARAATLKAPTGRSARTIADLRRDPHVMRVAVDHRRYRAGDPTGEPLWAELWGLDNTGQDLYQGQDGTGGVPDADIDGRQALGITTGSPTTVVAVIDDGVDFSHPDLAARAWTNPGESGGGKETNGIDDDGNGYVDDVHGWDFCHNDDTVHDFADDFHGTHVAGTIAASLDGEGVVGVAPSVSIMALKFLGDPSDPACGHDSQAIAAIAYAKSFGVRIANASWGGVGLPSDAPDLRDAIASSGMLFVAAAGNAGTDNDAGPDYGAGPTTFLPASFDLPNIISVAAIDNTGELASFSDFGAKTVDIVAPGEAILSTLPADATHPQPGWGWLDGTSMATPHVSGTAALVGSAFPNLLDDPIALKARLLDTGKPDAATAGKTVTGRLIDPYRALDVVPPLAQAPTTFGFELGATMGATSAVTRIGWPGATDDRTGIAAYGLQAAAGSGAWSTVVGATGSRTALKTLTFRTTTQVRDRARDGAGNWGPWSRAASITAFRYQENSAAVAYHGTWHVLRTASASGGLTRYATSAGASVTLRFTGRAFALVAPRGPTRGSARIYIDGVYGGTVNLHATRWAPRVVVAGHAWSLDRAHTIKLVLSGTTGHPRFDIDAFVVLR